MNRRARGEPDPTSEFDDEQGETSSARQKPSRKDRKRKKDGPATVDVDEKGNATTSGGGKKNKSRKFGKKNRDQQVSANKQAQRAEDASSIGGMDDDEPPSARHAANQPNSKRAPSEQDLRNDKGPKVAVVEHHDEQPRSPQRSETPNRVENELEAHRRRRGEQQAQRDVEDSPSSQDTAGQPEGNEGAEMAESTNPYAAMIDPSNPAALKQTLLEASNASLTDAQGYEERATQHRQEAQNLADKGDVFSESQENFLRRAAEDDETAANRRGQAAVFAEKSQQVKA